ncbi:hypothetical protein HC928_26250, partial [bacterium]|nr:hypothetical protein [bacterium]
AARSERSPRRRASPRTRAGYERHTRLDMDYLFALCEELGRDPRIREGLLFRPNSSLYRAAGRLRRQPGQRERKVLNFIGHSMGGATLFYMDPLRWAYGEATRCALAPALLLEDDMHRAFFSTLGLGIGILQRVPVLEVVERFIKPTVISTLCSGSSDLVKELHRQQYDETPRGITGATFMAMGRLRNDEIARDWGLSRVMLGHRDVLVGLVPMMDLLCRLEFPAANVRVVAGTHYMFSIGNEDVTNAFQHVQNRELVVRDVLALHQSAYSMQQEGYRVG